MARCIKRLEFWSFALVIAMTIVLFSCGGSGSSSGVGGTGITRVSGNISSVVARGIIQQNPALPKKMLADLMDFLNAPANAQASGISNVPVSGGGKSTTTNQAGSFTLDNVDPSNNFTLTFGIPGGTVSLTIGPVGPGTIVNVVNIVINTTSNTATSGGVNVSGGSGNTNGAGGNENGGENENGGNDNTSDDEDSGGGGSGPG